MGPESRKRYNKRYPHVYAVILAGGKGKRLRPLSSDLRPKAFLSVTRNRRTMLGNTFDRIARLIDPGRIMVSANRAHLALVRKDLPRLPAGNILLEDVSRNTAPAIALAARALERRDKDAVMLILHADQYVTGREGGLSPIRKALDFVAANGDAILVVGVRPTRAACEYGYIETAGPGTVVKADRFTEKPPPATARRYLAGGRHLWNAGVFIFRADAILDSFRKHAPEIFRASARKAAGRTDRGMPVESIDRAILEKADNVYCVRGSYGWSDLGTFDAIEKVLRKESRRFIRRGGKIVEIL